VTDLTKRAALLALLASLPAGALAAPAARGLAHQRTISFDSSEVALRSPEGVACDDRGAVVIADTGNARLLTFTWKEGVLEGGAQVKLPQLSYPVRVQIDSKGFVLALDRRTRRVVRVDARGAYAGYVEGKGATAPLTAAAFKLDAADNVYVLDVVARKVVVVAPDGRVSRELPLPKGARGVMDVAADSAGRVYLVDGVSAVVFVAEPAATAFQPLSKSLKEMVSFPTYLTPDNRGKLYVVDQNGNAVVRLGTDGAYQTRELGMGWTDGAVYYPGQICVTSEGDLLVADRNNNRVQIFSGPR
jgi:NHL repeat